MQETRVQSLGWEDPLEEGMATDSSILAWEFPRTEEPGGLQSMGLQRIGHDSGTNTFSHEDPISSPILCLFCRCPTSGLSPSHLDWSSDFLVPSTHPLVSPLFI